MGFRNLPTERKSQDYNWGPLSSLIHKPTASRASPRGCTAKEVSMLVSTPTLISHPTRYLPSGLRKHAFPGLYSQPTALSDRDCKKNSTERRTQTPYNLLSSAAFQSLILKFDCLRGNTRGYVFLQKGYIYILHKVQLTEPSSGSASSTLHKRYSPNPYHSWKATALYRGT